MSGGNKKITMYVSRSAITVPIINRINEMKQLIWKYQFGVDEFEVAAFPLKVNELKSAFLAKEREKEEKRQEGEEEQERQRFAYPLFEYEDEYIGTARDLLEFFERYEEENKEKERNQNIQQEEQKREQEEEEEKEPVLGYISSSMQYVEHSVKGTYNWLTSWFSSPQPQNNEQNNNNINNEDNVSPHDNQLQHLQIEEKDDVLDLNVVQTNWYWRQQNRVLRFNKTKKKILRIDPFDNSIREEHWFEELNDFEEFPADYFLRVSFRIASGKPNVAPSLKYEYYTCAAADYPIFVELLKAIKPINPEAVL